MGLESVAASEEGSAPPGGGGGLMIDGIVVFIFYHNQLDGLLASMMLMMFAQNSKKDCTCFALCLIGQFDGTHNSQPSIKFTDVTTMKVMDVW